MEYTNSDFDSRLMKKHMNRLGLMLVAYTALMTLASFIYICVWLIGYMVKHPEINDIPEEQINQLIDHVTQGGTIYFFSVAVAFISIILYRRKKLFTYDLVVTNRKMSAKYFGLAFICVIGIQFIFMNIFSLVEMFLNAIGFSVMSEIESATAQSTTITMFLYAGIIGPVVEEIVFRGAVLRSVEKYGKMFAIIVSSIFFGVFHGNLLQGIFAFFLGIVFAYIALEYSIKWTILLHIINNILGDMVSYMTSGLNEKMVYMIQYFIFGIFFIAMCRLLFQRRSFIKNYMEEHSSIKKSYKYMFTRFWVIIFIIIELITAFSSIQSFR